MGSLEKWKLKRIKKCVRRPETQRHAWAEVERKTERRDDGVGY